MLNSSRFNGIDGTESVAGDAQEAVRESPVESSAAALAAVPGDDSRRDADTRAATPRKPRQHIFRLVLSWLLLLAIVAAGILLWLHHDVVIDWVHTRGYHPPSNIVRLADNTTMTPYARRLFYVNYPAIEDKDAFNRDCPDASHEVAVLGCYRGNRNGIYLYHVTDERLAGIAEVTAAHEMLHQAFDRLSPSDKAHVTAMLQDYYSTKLTDKDVKAKMVSYNKLEPNDLATEMHSIFGTEIGTLPPDLEEYYKQYFTDRSKVVMYRDRYVSAFSQRQQQIDQFDTQRDQLKQKIDQTQAELDNWEKQLQTKRDQMNAYLAANKVEAYNAMVPDFNAQVAAYKAKVANTNDLINQYNTLTDERNALTAQEQELIKAQDSHASSADTE